MKQKIRGVLALSILAVTGLVASVANPLSAFAFLFVAGNLLARQSGSLCVTLTATEMLLDVIRAFRTRIPAAMLLGNEWRSTPLKYNGAYTAHIASVPTAESMASTYAAASGNVARDMLTDVDITVSSRYGTPLDWTNLTLISDRKNEYDKVIGGAGYALAKVFIDDLLSMAKSQYFSYSAIYTTANSDVDMVNEVTENLNTQGAYDSGRVMIVNSAVATTLSADARLASRDYSGQYTQGNGYRQFRDVNGFALIQEYPSLSLNNGTAVTGGAIEADDEVYTKTAHGLVTGQRVVLTSFSGGTGLTAATVWFFHALTANTGYLCATPTLAVAGTAGTACTVDATSVVLTPTENLTAFASDMSGIQFLAGPEDHTSQYALMSQLGIPSVMGFETVTEPESGITMSAVGYQDSGTGNLRWIPMLLWGKVAGRKAGTNAVGSNMDKGGFLIHSS